MEHTQQDRLKSSSKNSGSRASGACARCRRQKLKCDTAKPCTMCIRSGMVCEARVCFKTKPKRPRTHVLSDDKDQVLPPLAWPAVEQSWSPLSPPTSENAASVEAQTIRASPEVHQFGINKSTISLATNVYRNLGTRAPTETSTIPGDLSRVTVARSQWKLRTMSMPQVSVMEILINVYFEKWHWFVCIFHKPSFISMSRRILSSVSWYHEDMVKVLLVLMVAVIGLACDAQGGFPLNQQLPDSITSDHQQLIDQLVNEVRLHLPDLIEENCLESVQIYVLLGTFHVFHGSPNLAWASFGLAVRTSYALALHCDIDVNDPIVNQVRRRCWNHLTIADTFASQIYGRPTSIDPAFGDLLPVSELDDTILDIPDDACIHRGNDGSISRMTFHRLKYTIYDIIRKALSQFRMLRLHKPMTAEELMLLIHNVQDIDARLACWRKTLPPVFKDDWMGKVDILCSTNEGNRDFRIIKLQMDMLRITYDAALIMAHRPLLEHKLSPEYRLGLSRNAMDAVSRSFDICVNAALRISKVPIIQYEKEYCVNVALVHSFTAGVILCIPPTSHPFSSNAQEAKAGVLRIIRAVRLLNQHSQVAQHTERLLSDLLKLSLQRELDLALEGEHVHGHEPEQNSHPSQQACTTSVHLDQEPAAEDGDHQCRPTSNTAAYHYDNATLQVAPNANSGSSMPSQLQTENNEDGGDHWFESYLMFSHANQENLSNIQPLDSQIDEAFGLFGQVIFNLTPDDPLNSWSWGK